MGVIKTFDYGRTPPILRSSEESLTSVEVSIPPTPPSEAEDTQTHHERRNQNNLRRRDPALLLQRLEILGRKRTGARKARRENNAQALQTLTEDEEESFSIPKIEDFRPNSESPLSRLFTDSNCMRIWDYFLAQTEEEQKNYLEYIEDNKRKSSVSYGFWFAHKRNTNDDSEDIAKLALLTPEQRFIRISRNLRSALKHRCMPNEILGKLESDIVQAFTEDDSMVYISKELSKFERLLLHGISQYHLLKSRSINVAGGRHTKIENQDHLFSSSVQPLTDFLRERKQSMNN